MTIDPQDNFNEAPEERIRALKSSPTPPARLEESVVQALYREGLLRIKRRGFAVYLRQAAVLAACIALFAGGVLVGKRTRPAPAASAGSRYVLLLSQIDGPQGSDPILEAQRVTEYRDWARNQRAAGHLLLGEKLEDDALLLKDPNAGIEVVHSQDSVSGLFLIAAQNLDGAVAVARTCPHLRYGGRIVIRPVADVPAGK